MLVGFFVSFFFPFFLFLVCFVFFVCFSRGGGVGRGGGALDDQKKNGVSHKSMHSVSQGWVYQDDFMCCHTEIEGCRFK